MTRPPVAHIVDPLGEFKADGTEPCIGHTDLFFPDPTWRLQYRDAVDLAQRLCNSCPRQFECLWKARYRNERHGTWGGVNFDAGHRTKRNRRRANPTCTDCGKRCTSTAGLEEHRRLVHRAS
jgi:hypothetical protein